MGANISLLTGLRNTRRHFGGVCGVFPEMLNQDGTSLSAGDTSRIKRTLLSASWLWCKVATARDTLVTCPRLPHHRGPGKDTPHPFGLTLLLWRVLSQWWESTFIMLLIRSRFAGQVPRNHCFQSLHSGWGKQQSLRNKRFQTATRSRKGKKSYMKMFTCDWAIRLKRNYGDMITWYEVIWHTMMYEGLGYDNLKWCNIWIYDMIWRYAMIVSHDVVR